MKTTASLHQIICMSSGFPGNRNMSQAKASRSLVLAVLLLCLVAADAFLTTRTITGSKALNSRISSLQMPGIEEGTKPITFEFASANQIIFGNGVAKRIPDIAAGMGAKTVLVVTGKSGAERHRDIAESLVAKGMSVHSYVVGREPTISDIDGGAALARSVGADLVVGVGGGSVVDAGKAIAALITNTEEVLHYLEVVGRAQPLTEDPAPYIAVPTTAGTGSEVTKNSVIKSEKDSYKASIRHVKMVPDVAVVDPVLTLGVPPTVTAHTGLDALCQCMEPFLSCMANPVTDALAKEGMSRAVRSLRTAVADGNNLKAREDMALCSVLGGLCLANAKLGAVHGFSGVLGGMFEEAPHGLICAALLPHAFRVNVRVLTREVNAGNLEYQKYLDRHAEVAQLLTGNLQASAEDGAIWLETLTKDLNIPSLAGIGMKPEHYANAVEMSKQSSSMKGNPIVLSSEELLEILEAAV